jgi:hypothetical protein
MAWTHGRHVVMELRRRRGERNKRAASAVVPGAQVPSHPVGGKAELGPMACGGKSRHARCEKREPHESFPNIGDG